MIIKIFKAGTYPQGRWDRERVQRLVDAYDPEGGIEAPCVVGHKESFNVEGELSHGWVRSLRLDDQGEVWADIEASEELRQWVATRRLGYVSVGILADDEKDEKLPPRLAHVAFLGRSIPQIPTTRLPSLYSRSEGENEDEPSIFNNKIRIKRDLINVKTFVRGIPFGGGAGGSEKPEESSNKEYSMEKENERISSLEEENSKLKSAFEAEKKKREDFETKEEKQTIVSRIDALVKDGRVAPAAKDALVDAALSVSGEKRESFFNVLDNSLKPIVSEDHFAKDGATPKTMSNSEIRAFATERKIDFEAAVEVLQREGRLNI